MENNELENISNEYHELQYVADKFDLPVWVVVKAKEELGTSNRLAIYDYLTKYNCED